MNIIKAYIEKNPCYTRKATMKPTTLMLHSVGCPQPSGLTWQKKFNSASASKAVHAVIDANTGDVYQLLPWNYKAWHCGGKANAYSIGVEMGEPSAIKYTTGVKFTVTDMTKAQQQARTAYNSAVKLFAYLCKAYKLDPLEKGVIISHNEGRITGVASSHVDPEHLWKGLGWAYTMDDFRQDVAKAMNPTTSTVTTGYKVRITADTLNVREKASALSKKVTTLKKGDVYTIVAESSNGWGQLKSKCGWISLKYTEKI